MTIIQKFLKRAACTVSIFVDDEPTAAADLSNLDTEGAFMNKPYCFENKSQHLV